tara:strand:+ start:60 stop:626 length:567 start_codon:yes stop_codon:yes gene_type:complete
MEIFNLFPTLIMKFTEVLSSSELDSIFEKLKKHKSAEFSSVWVRSRSSYPIQNDILSELGLKKRIQKRIDEYCDQVKLNYPKISKSWFTITDVGGMVKEHDHPGSLVSGSLYINVDEYSNPIIFKNPNPIVSFNLISSARSDLSPYTYRDYTFIPKKGDLLLFPSLLEHGCAYTPNQTVDRTIISFNT